MTVSIYQRAPETSYAAMPAAQSKGAVVQSFAQQCTHQNVDVTNAVKKFVAKQKPYWTEAQAKTKIQEVATNDLIANMSTARRIFGIKPKAKLVESVNLNDAKKFINAVLPEDLKAQMKTASEQELTKVTNVIANTAAQLVAQFAAEKEPKLSIAQQRALNNKPRAMGTGF